MCLAKGVLKAVCEASVPEAYIFLSPVGATILCPVTSSTVCSYALQMSRKLMARMENKQVLWGLEQAWKLQKHSTVHNRIYSEH